MESARFNQENASVTTVSSNLRLAPRRDLLQEVLNLPMEMFFEIISYLQPLDLLRLSRARFPNPRIPNHSPNSQLLAYYVPSPLEWRKTFENVQGLPSPPESMREAQYARIMFAKECHECGRHSGNIKIHIIWAARMRLCTRCLGTLFVERREVLDRTTYPRELINLLPTFKTSKVLYCAKFAEKWEEGYTNAPHQGQWVASKMTARIRVIETDTTYLAWFKSLEELQKLQIEARRESVIQYLRNHGWADEISRMNEVEVNSIRNHKFVVKACRKEFNDRTCNDLASALVPLLEDIRFRRLEKECMALLEQRLQVLAEAMELYSTPYLPANALYPTIADLFCHPLIQNIFEQASPADVFTPATFLGLPYIALNWQEDVERQLCEMVLSVFPHLRSHRGILNLAIISFVCSECRCRGPDLTYPRVLMHKCARESNEDLDGQSDGERILRRMSSSVRWNAKRNITLDVPMYHAMRVILDTVHLDPWVTTKTDMENLNMGFECVSCNNPHAGRPWMTWGGLAFHLILMGPNQARTHNFRQLTWQAAEQFRQTVLAYHQRQRADRNHKGLVCMGCKLVGNSVQLAEHVYSVHGIQHPTREHITPLLDSDTTPPAFMTWPPLK